MRLSIRVGDIIVILDADALLPAHVIEHCATELRQQRLAGKRGWFVPYEFLWRLLRRPHHREIA